MRRNSMRSETGRAVSAVGGFGVYGLLAAAVLSSWLTSGCGSGGGEDNPQLPDVVIIPQSLLVDVGAQVVLDGSETTMPRPTTTTRSSFSGAPSTRP